MSDWDDLFSAAAGTTAVATDDHDTGEAPDLSQGSQMEMKETRKKRRHNSSSSGDSDSAAAAVGHKHGGDGNISKKQKIRSKAGRAVPDNRSPLEQFLDSRTDPINEQLWSEIPAWMSIGESLCKQKVCSQWKQKQARNGGCSMSAKCQRCKLSLLHHSLSVSSALTRSQAGKMLEAFALVRDIRCCCSCILDEAYGNGNGAEAQSRYRGYTMTILEKSDQLRELGMGFYSTIPTGEANILIAKFNKVSKTARALSEKMKQWFKGKEYTNHNDFKLSGVFEEIVHLIISCDGAYFRMYYLQNCGFVTIPSEVAFLPHPTTYFGSQNLTWNVAAKDYIAELAESMKKSSSVLISDDRWNELMKGLGANLSSTNNELDSLSYLHQNRLSESIFIFHKSGWIDSDVAKEKTMQSLKYSANPVDDEDAFYLKHETPASLIVKEWRDSCRDLLCNLYAYATLSPDHIKGIKTTLQHASITNVIEMGAGTGYVAHLLREAGLTVSAYDVAPTKPTKDQPNNTSSNEYHGSSPPFCNVSSAESKTLKSIIRKRDSKKTALLLCYPPPRSDMALEAAKAFIKRGGKTIIYIGEFNGLTGSSPFENKLQHWFELKYRASCLHWGTDAAEVTIWSMSDGASASFMDLRSEILVPCSQCKQSAVSRSRLSRPLAYCSNTCFNTHKYEREVHFAFNMIPMVIAANEMISFLKSGREHFHPLVL